jgi:elongation factor P
MLSYNEIIPKTFIELDGSPYEVISSNVLRKQQRRPVNQTKLKNLITGKVTERTFGQSEKAEEAEIDTKELKYLYNNKGEYWFGEPDNPQERFNIDTEKIPGSFKFVKENDIVQALSFNDEIIGFKIPIKVSLKVKEAPPAVRGNTSSGANKVITLETGATVNAPIFVKEGDSVEVNTETGEYAGRAS